VANVDDRTTSLVLSTLSDTERQSAVAYLRPDQIDPGARFPALPVPIVPRSASFLAFIDPTPSANWGHNCRYLIIDAESFDVTSHPARFPPFYVRGEQEWRVVYRAPGVLDSFIYGGHR
jgi:hypothetical protein